MPEKINEMKKLMKPLWWQLLILMISFSAIAQEKTTHYQIVASDGAWCWYSDPRAVYHKGKTENIYFTYINSKGDVLIGARNQKTKAVTNFVLHEKLQIDDHDVPSILILPDGKLMVFYTEHNGRFFIRKSKYPEDISAWDEERIIPFGGKKITYSHPVMLRNEKNRIYMFWRGSDWRPSMAYSDDLGETWSKSQGLIKNKNIHNRPYLKVCSDNKSRIDFAFTDGHPGSEPTNSLYHMYYEAGKFYQSNGEFIALTTQLPIKPNVVRKVYDATKDSIRCWISDIALTADKKPVLVYTRYPKETDHRYHYAQWDGNHWQDEELTAAGPSMCVVPEGVKNTEPFYSGGISLDHSNPANVYLALKKDKTFEIERWHLRDKKWLITPITTNSDENNYRPVVAANGPAKKTFLLWMTGQYQHYTKFYTKLRFTTLDKKK